MVEVFRVGQSVHVRQVELAQDNADRLHVRDRLDRVDQVLPLADCFHIDPVDDRSRRGG